MKNLMTSLLASMLMLSPYASAVDFSNCTIVEIVLSGDQNAHVQLSCQISPVPSCAVFPSYFGFDKSTSAGKQYLVAVIAAHALGAKVEGHVDQNQGSCPLWQPNIALLTHLRVKK